MDTTSYKQRNIFSRRKGSKGSDQKPNRKEFQSIEKYKKVENSLMNSREEIKSKTSTYKNPYLALGSKKKKQGPTKR